MTRSQLASKQPQVDQSDTTRASVPQYYMFGAPGSAACAARAKQTGQINDRRPALPARAAAV